MKSYKSKSKFTIAIIFVVLILTVIGLVACVDQNSKPTIPDDILQEVEMLEEVTANDVLKGATLADVTLSGKFADDGELQFIATQYNFDKSIPTIMQWQFTPTDLTKYIISKGNVLVGVYDHKITLIENGGFTISDAHFNDTYSLGNDALTAKNNYRFDGWTQADGSKTIISREHVFTEDETVYASYSFHTAEKLNYRKEISYIDDEDGESVPSGEYYFIVYPAHGSIGGEVIVADMIDGIFAEVIYGFSNTNIAKIEFGRFVKRIARFNRCKNLTEIFIPNTIMEVDSTTFADCTNLKTVVMEDGDDYIHWGGDTFPATGLESITINRIKFIGGQEFFGTPLKSIFIPKEIENIGDAAFANCTLLTDVEFEEGSKLKKVYKKAFAATGSLTNINIPASASIHATAFRSSRIATTNITQGQLTSMAKSMFNTYVADDGMFNMKYEVDAKYTVAEGAYNPSTNTITIKYNGNVDMMTIYALSHEFFHYLQTVCLGKVEGKTKQMVFDKMDRVDQAPGQKYEITEEMISSWDVPYIPPTTGNFDDYWNQAFEADARHFAYLMTAIKLPKPTNP